MNDFRTKPDAVHKIPTRLYECREIMAGHLKQSLQIVMDEVDDVLLDIATNTTNSQERTKYFNAMHELRLKRHHIERKFIEKNIAGFLNDVYSEIDDIFETGQLTRGADIGNHQIPMENNSTKDDQKIADVKQVVTSEIQNLLEDKHVPDFVSDFLLKNWVKLLTKIHNKNGINSDSWQHAIDTVKDMIFCVGNISAREDKDKFNELWPDLLMRLRNGINMISMSPREESDFISRLSKHKATLTMLEALSKSKSNDVTIIKPEKINALKMKLKSTVVQPVAKMMDLDSTASKNVTMPSLRTYACKPQFVDEQLVDSDGREMDFDSIGSEDNTIPILGTKAFSRPFMDELLVDNHDVEGFMGEIDEN